MTSVRCSVSQHALRGISCAARGQRACLINDKMPPITAHCLLQLVDVHDIVLTIHRHDINLQVRVVPVHTAAMRMTLWIDHCHVIDSIIGDFSQALFLDIFDKSVNLAVEPT